MSGDLLSRYPPGGGALRERAARAPAGEAGGRARGPEDQPVPILMYHAVTRSPAAATRALSVTPDAFAEQMAMVTAYGCTPLTTAQLATRWRTGRPLPPRPVLITFDDGYEGVHRHALPVLAELALPATVFVTTGWLRGLHEVGGAPDRMLDWGQVRELAAAGVEIGGHSHTHPQLDQLTPAASPPSWRTAGSWSAPNSARRPPRSPTRSATPTGGCGRRYGRPGTPSRWRSATSRRAAPRARTRCGG